MKTFFTFAILFLILNHYSAQTASVSEPDKSALVVNTNNCSLFFSETEGALVFRDSTYSKCYNLTIEDLKPFSSGSFQVKTTLTVGAYTFHKGSKLEIPEDHHVYMEDQLTGQLFDLNSSTEYSFKVSRTIADRFVLHIEKLELKTANKTALR